LSADAVRTRTDRPFGVNLIPAATDPGLLEAELSVCLKKKVHSLCFFWDVHADVIARAKGCRMPCPVSGRIG
jgi:nitronate monooxygenase